MVLLDVSRLLTRAQRWAPTGVDRVEHAYATELLRQVPNRLSFVMVDRLNRIRYLPHRATIRFLQTMGGNWHDGGAAGVDLGVQGQMLWMRAVLRLGVTLPRLAPSEKPIYLLTSHSHLHRPGRVEAVLAQSGARLVPFVHDLIPIDFPEYVRPGHDERHRQRIQTIARLADAVVVATTLTRAGLQPWLRAAERSPPVLVSPLGAHLQRAAAPAAGDGRPYFVCISTIEPRKNHLLLLQIWRRLAQTLGAAAPRLVLVGHRGWENENVIDMLERSDAIRPHVLERTGLSDSGVAALLSGSRALLYPSFAEGFGLPIIEALATGTPVICSDLPVLREVAGSVPDFLDPLDGLGWAGAVLDYCRPDSPQRAAQLSRLASWQTPDWSSHVGDVLQMVDGLPPGG